MKFLSPFIAPPATSLVSWFFPVLRSSSFGLSKLPSFILSETAAPPLLLHQFPTQSELGINRLFSLAAWGSLHSPCSCFFPVFVIHFPDWISFFRLLLHCISLMPKGCWGLALFLPEQTARGPRPAQDTVAALGKSACVWDLSGTLSQ